MAHRRVLLLTAILFKILLLTFILSSFDVRTESRNGCYVFCGANWDSKQFLTRNSSLPRQTKRSRSNLMSVHQQLVSIIGLTEATLLASQLVVLAGDVSMNPGPMDVCQACNKGCRKNQTAIQCDDCDLWYHTRCINMAEWEFLHLTTPQTSWICTSCICPFASSSTSELNFASEDPQINLKFADIRLKRGFKIAHLNVNRLICKFDEIKKLLQDHSFDVLSLTETWLTSNVSNDELNISGYTFVRKDRSDPVKSQGGGVLVYVKDGIPYNTISCNANLTDEHIWIEIKRLHCKRMIIGSIYRPPDLNLAVFAKSLRTSLELIYFDSCDLVILGDFNTNVNNGLPNDLRSFALEYSLEQLINDYTRISEHSRTTIDLLFVSCSHKAVQAGVMHPLISDHSLIFCVIKGGVKRVPPKQFEYRCFKNYSKVAFVNDLNGVPWSAIEGVEDIDEQVFMWEHLFSEVADSHAPIKFMRVKGTKNPWVTRDLIKMRYDKHYYFKKAKATNSAYHWKKYKSLRNSLNQKERKLKSDYYCKLIEESKGDGKKMWKAIKETLPQANNSDINAIYDDNFKLRTESMTIASILNKHFTSIGKKILKLFTNTPTVWQENDYYSYPSEFHLQSVTYGYVDRELAKLKPNKSAGLDKIGTRLLKDAASVIAPVLTNLINNSFSNGCFPKRWKSAKVLALFKDGERTSKDNYRPISVLPAVSKIIERIAHDQLSAYLKENSILSSAQFGFRANRSTELALTNFTDSILKYMDNKQVTGVVYLDLKKAFDTINHQALMKKLKCLGVHGRSLCWFKSFLSNRSQRTVIGNSLSTSRKISVGVPQGSILGPLLFLVHINGVQKCLKHCQMIIFADDIALFCPATTQAELQSKLDTDLRSVMKWLENSKLLLNVSKSKLMIIGNSRKLKQFTNVQLVANDAPLERVQTFKYLGVVIDENLSWKSHLEKLQGKVLQRLGILRRLKHLLPRRARTLFVNTMIISILEYGSLVWGDKDNKVCMDNIQVLHNKAAKLVLDRPMLSSSTDALETLNWLTLRQRRSIHRCIYVYKSINGMYDIKNTFIRNSDVHSYNTRHRSDLRSLKSSTSKGLLRSNCNFISDWNMLDEDTRLLSCLTSFKLAVFRFFRFSRY